MVSMTTTTAVRGGVGIGQEDVKRAVLKIAPAGGLPASELAATSIKVTDNGREISLAFPSLELSKLIEKGKPVNATLEIAVGSDAPVAFSCRYVPVLAGAGFTMAVRAKSVLSTAGRGEVQVTFVRSD